MISANEVGYLCILHWDTTREAMMGAAMYLIHSLQILSPFSYLSIVQASITRYAQDTIHTQNIDTRIFQKSRNHRTVLYTSHQKRGAVL